MMHSQNVMNTCIFYITNGVHQGCVLSLLLFGLSLHEMLGFLCVLQIIYTMI